MHGNEKTQQLLGFEEDSICTSLQVSSKYKSALEKFEWSITTLASSDPKLNCRMDFSLTRCYEDAASCSNASFRGIVMDNDSGYISQNVESNSSVEAAVDGREVTAAPNMKNVYLNEDTLLEKPQISPNYNLQEDSEEEFKEFDHLFYMSGALGPILDSSVTSQKTAFSGFDGDESRISDTSGIIPIATPLVLPLNVLNIESNSNEGVNGSTASRVCSKENVSDTLLSSAIQNSEEFTDNLKENNLNYVNTDGSFKLISHEGESLDDKCLNSMPQENENNLSCIQKRIMNADNCTTSLFESFYMFVCDLYTKNDGPMEELGNLSINPHNLQIDRAQENIPSESPTENSYLQLETSVKQSTFLASTTHTVTASSAPILQTSWPLQDSENNAEIRSDQPATETNQLQSEIHETTKQPEIKVSQPNMENCYANSKTVAVINAPATPLKQCIDSVNLQMSPELFSDEEPSESPSCSTLQLQKMCEQLYITKNDRRLLKRVQESLGGVPPPPSVTIVQMSAAEMLEKIKDNRHLFVTKSTSSVSGELNVNSDVDNYVNSVQMKSVNTDEESGSRNANKLNGCQSGMVEKYESLLVTCRREDFASAIWPDVMRYRYHGLHHNRSKVSEEFEHLCVKYAARYIGVETQSSCTVFGMVIMSPSKRRCKIKRPAKSPGKRLSHLARRRITFSKDSLHSAVGPSSCSFIGARTRQIMVDARKFELLSRRRSPKRKSPRKTPGKSPRKRSQTPSSSSKKRFAMRLRMHNSEESVESVMSVSSSRASATKRALFQSPPDKAEGSSGLQKSFGSNTSISDLSESGRRRTPRRSLFTSPLKTSPSKMSISSLYPAKRKVTPKRALFKSPDKASPSKCSEDKKRKRTDTDDGQPTKFSRSLLLESKESSNESKPRSLLKSYSSSTAGSLPSQNIAEHRKKKLMWAVAEALRSQNIDLKHPQFKVFASVLARIIRHFLPNLFTNGPRPEGSTTESMLRIARQHVFAVTRGKTVDQVIREAQNSKVRASRPTGYVGLDQVESSLEIAQARNKENVLQDRVNTIASDHRRQGNGYSSKARRGENVERIRRVINFGDDEANDR